MNNVEGSSTSNREKVYSTGGEACFKKVYNYINLPVCGSLQIYVTTFKATKAIMKSPNARNNRHMICKKGRTLYVVGEITGPDTREYLVYSEETWVFKRAWADLKDFVVPVGARLQQTEILKAGD